MTSRIKTTSVPRFEALLDWPMRSLSPLKGLALASFLGAALVSFSNNAVAAEDPYENINRVTHGFNQTLDAALLKPVATTYQRVTPKAAKRGVRNVFSNLDDIKVSFNHLAQLKLGKAASDLGRFAVNSTLGIAGIFDVADPVFGLEKNHQDFGQTLASWDVDSGPYIVLPFFGPSTARGSIGRVVDSFVIVVPNTSDVPVRNMALATDAVSDRAEFLVFDDLVVGDHYLFMREAYLQRRAFQVTSEFMGVEFEDF